MLPAEEAEELARMALAAMDSEPVENHIGSKNALDAIVSFIKSKSNPTVKCYEEVSEHLFKYNCHGIHSHVIEYILKLGEELEDLRAEQAEMQPAPVVPVVPDEMTPEQAHEIGYYYGDPVDVFARGANWMRQHIIDSTLAATPQLPGSEPATVPGKWIPVSERMPETDGNYWGWWSESKRQGPVWFIKSELQAQFQSSEITHWMPLPAAPQEVKGE
ncbi:DUF551 domain-containing protein [Klebsiella michiganensis]|nr:DUF551 domain-containing protein [Klebsiella michiganensis]